MRINRVEITNFKAFTRLELDLHEGFNLLVGINGAGKTSILDALAVATGIWHVAVPTDGWRNIDESEIHRRVVPIGDTVRFAPEPYAEIAVSGEIDGQQVNWKRLIRHGGRRTSNAEAKKALAVIDDLIVRERTEPSNAVLPVLAYYSAARLGLPSRHSSPKWTDSQSGRERFDAYYHCLDGSIRHGRLNDWFLWAAVAAGQNQERAGHRAVRQAVMECLPDCRKLWFDSERKEIVADLGGTPVPYYSLSAGQQVMLAVAADIAIKAETLNPQLGEDMVKKTPGIVMIDELDVHLHPSWQRRVVKDLQNAFPSLQFICTTHSPQVIGETPRDKVQKVTRAMEGQGFTEVAGVALGADSNWLLEFEMGAKPRNERSAALVHEIEEALDSPDLTRAREKLTELRSFLRGDDGETVRLESTIHHLEALAREND